MQTAIQQVLFGNRNGRVPPPGFFAPLINSAILERGIGNPTFTRATTAYVTDFEGLAKNCKSGEVRFTGARRVENLVSTKSEDWTDASWTKTIGTVTATTLTSTAPNQTVLQTKTAASSNWVLRVRMSRITGTGNIQLTLDNGGTWTTVVLTTSPQIFSIAQSALANPQFGIRIVTSGDAINADQIQLENTIGQGNTNPSEYVSVGVLSSPYQGAMVDGVKYFPYQNGNTVASNMVTEGQGAAIANATLKGYLSELDATQLVTPTASVRDMTDASWAKVTMSAAKTATGIDGVANSASTITASGANATILQTLTAAASSRTYSAYVKRRTGTGTVLMKQGATTLDITASINSSTYTLVQLNASVLNVAFGFQINTSGDAIDVDFNQFEAAPIATSPMATAGAARNADILTYQTASNWLDSAGSCYAEYLGIHTINTGQVRGIVSSVAFNIWGPITIQWATDTTFSATDGTNTATSTAIGSFSSAIHKLATSWGGAAMKCFLDGSAGTGAAYAGFNATQIAIGHTANTNQARGNIRNVRIWQTRLSDLCLQSMTQ